MLRGYLTGLLSGTALSGVLLAGVSVLSDLPSDAPPEATEVEVPAGSVAIAETQTGVYPVPSPGGWRLIGRTPVSLFNPLEDSPALLRPGDRLRFIPIESKEDYKEIENRCKTGEYVPEVIYL